MLSREKTRQRRLSAELGSYQQCYDKEVLLLGRQTRFFDEVLVCDQFNHFLCWARSTAVPSQLLGLLAKLSRRLWRNRTQIPCKWVRVRYHQNRFGWFIFHRVLGGRKKGTWHNDIKHDRALSRRGSGCSTGGRAHACRAKLLRSWVRIPPGAGLFSTRLYPISSAS